MALSKGHTFTSGEVVTPTKLNNLVDNATIGDGTITTAMIADDAVTADKIATGAVTSDALASDALGAFSIDDLTDVDTSSVAPTDGQALVWDNANSQWEPGTASSSVSTYNSGWVNQSPVDSTSVAANTDLNFTHGLGTVDVVWQIYAADDSSGTNSVAIDIQLDQLNSVSDTWGAAIIDVTTTTCKLSLGSAYIHTAHNTGSGKSWAYVKVVGIG